MVAARLARRRRREEEEKEEKEEKEEEEDIFLPRAFVPVRALSSLCCRPFPPL